MPETASIRGVRFTSTLKHASRVSGLARGSRFPPRVPLVSEARQIGHPITDTDDRDLASSTRRFADEESTLQKVTTPRSSSSTVLLVRTGVFTTWPSVEQKWLIVHTLRSHNSSLPHHHENVGIYYPPIAPPGRWSTSKSSGYPRIPVLLLLLYVALMSLVRLSAWSFYF